MKKNIILSLIIFSLSLFFISCGAAESPIDESKTGPLKLVIFNNTEYDVKAIYYSEKAPVYNDYGVKINTDILKYQDSISICPKEGKYYFTFIRQNGSTNNNLYISSEKTLDLKSKAGVFTLELLPYNFFYDVKDNNEAECVGDN